MVGKITDKKYIKILSALCFMVYFTSYITRVNYAAIISEIIAAEGFLKSDVSLVTTASFISYGVGQLISGIMGEKFQAKWLMFSGLFISSMLNLLMPFCTTIQLMAFVWFINGFAQAMMWPPLIKIMSKYLDELAFQRACINVSIASSAATISIYLFSPIIIIMSGWKMVFFFSSIIGFIVSIVWLLGFYKIEEYASKHGHENSYNHNQISCNVNTCNCINICDNNACDNMETGLIEEKEQRSIISFKNIFFATGLLYIIIAVILQGILRDGVTTWMPSYISETYNLESSISILSVVVLPIFSILGTKSAAHLYSKVVKNELKCAVIMFGVGFVAALAMTFMFSFNAFTSIVLSAIITGSMHGVNFMLICMVPSRFEKYGKVSSISGLLNFFTYVGSAISTYGIARVSEQFGWHFTIVSWSLIALLGVLSCRFCIKKWDIAGH